MRAKLSNDSGEPINYDKPHEEVHPLDANLISSRKANGKHTLMLDLDVEHFVAASSTPGHNHLYVNTDLGYDELKEIIDVLAKHGVIQEGIKKQLDVSGFLTFRPPGNQKGNPYDDADLELAKKIKPIEEAKEIVKLKPLSPKFKALKNKLKSGEKVTSGELQNAFVEAIAEPNPIKFKPKPPAKPPVLEVFKVVVGAELAEQTFKALLNALGLDNVLGYNSTMKSFSTTTNVTYLGKRFCNSEYDAMHDSYLFTFYENDFYMGQYYGLSWSEVKSTLKTCFGG